MGDIAVIASPIISLFEILSERQRMTIRIVDAAGKNPAPDPNAAMGDALPRTIYEPTPEPA